MTTTEKGVLVSLWAMRDCDGDPRDAMLWAQITWWFQPAQRDGSARTQHLVERGGQTWMYTTDAELAEQTGMSTDQVYRGRRALVRRGLIESKASAVNGQKVTLVRPVAKPEDEENEGDPTADSRNLETADSRDATADSRNMGAADSRNLSIKNRDRRVEGSARAETSDARVDWQLPDVVASGGFLDAALELCDHWASRLEDRGVRAKERARSKTWVAPMEAMLRIDERDPLTARRVIDWLEDGRDEVATFWQGNVLSPAKLREKWEQMGQQYRRQQTRRPESQHDRGRSALLGDIERNKP